MIGVFAAALLASPFLSVIGPLVAVSAVALALFLSAAGLQLSPASAAVLFLVAAAVPSAAFLAAGLLRHMMGRPDPSKAAGFELLAVVMSCYLALQSGRVVSLFGAAGFLAGDRSPAELLEISSVAVGNTIFVGGLSALTAGLLMAATEILSGFGFRAARISVPISLPALRQIVLLIVVGAGFDLTIGLFSRNLAPLTLLRGLLP